MMVTIVFMALLAVLMTVYRKAGGAWRGAGRRLEFTPDQPAKRSSLMMDMRLEMPLQFSSDPVRMSFGTESQQPGVMPAAVRLQHGDAHPTGRCEFQFGKPGRIGNL
jgi:hypothetical protein